MLSIQYVISCYVGSVVFFEGNFPFDIFLSCGPHTQHLTTEDSDKLGNVIDIRITSAINYHNIIEHSTISFILGELL